ncbi:MAG: hypothetical protein M3P44_10550, partial [Actinomycetota bacterium]|nr:hypothetical protein [Actinomycetota bacterium]
MERSVADDPRVAVAVPPALAGVLAAWDEAGVRWCLLRGAEDLQDPAGDVDLLVDRSDAEVVRRLLTRHGAFLEKPAWGRRPHRFFVTYVEDEDRWLKLDLVTELCFGRRHELRTTAADAVLARTVRSGTLTHPAAPDAFWALLLHVLLDGRPPDAHRARELRQHAAAARTRDAPLADVVDAACPPGWDAARVVDAAAA